jgi:glycosyltransferase involved in cell wall biosynthesis
MKILVVQETDWITRYPHTQHHLFERLSLKGHTIKVIDYGFDWRKDTNRELFKKKEIFPHVSKIYTGSSIEVIRPSSLHVPILEYAYLMFSHYRELSHQIKKFDPDLIIGFGILNAYIASGLAKRYKIPFLYYWIDALDTLIPEHYLQKIGCFIEKKTINNSKRLFVTNEKLKDHLVGLGADSAHIEIFSSGIDFTRFNVNVNGDEIRRKYNIKDDQIVLFFMGWLYLFSGLKEVAIKIAQEKSKFEKFILFIVGDGDAYDDLIKIKENYQLDSNLILAGKQPYDMIPKFIAASDICILPAYPDEKIMQDIVPIKIFEYMAVGKPVITTKLSGVIKEFGTNNGVIYVDTPEGTVQKADELSNEGLIHDYGMKACSFVEPKNWVKITDCFEKSLEGVIRVQ